MGDYVVGGYSSIGKSHQDKGVKCQDSFYIMEGNGYLVAAVADGLSSSKHSDIASNLAVSEAVEYCLNHVNRNTDSSTVLEIIEKSFDEALFSIKQVAGLSLDDYDTTLSLVVYRSGEVWYGHVGDSGIIALCENGKFHSVTEAQKGEGIGEDRGVYPLAATQSWVFGKSPYKAKALYLVTDGVMKKMMPLLLEGQKYNINHRYLSYLYNHLCKVRDNGKATTWVQREVEGMSPKEVDYDDKTLIVIISKSVSILEQADEYYTYPTDAMWDNLQKALDKKMYPEKYGEEQEADLKLDFVTGLERDIESEAEVDEGLEEKTLYDSWKRRKRKEDDDRRRRRKRLQKRRIKIIVTISIIALLVLTTAYAVSRIIFPSGEAQEDITMEPNIIIEGTDVVYSGSEIGVSILFKNPDFEDAIINFGLERGVYTSNHSPTIMNVEDSPMTVYYRILISDYSYVEGSATVSIHPFDIRNAQITEIESQIFTGEELTPPLTIYANGRELVESQDYYLELRNNIFAGEATVIIHSINPNFSGYMEISFDIIPGGIPQ